MFSCIRFQADSTSVKAKLSRISPERFRPKAQIWRNRFSRTLASSHKERELERGLLIPLRDLHLELGRGFAFVGSQVPLEVDGQTFYFDLLFYHVRLHSYFVIELKVGPFKPEYAGKLNFTSPPRMLGYEPVQMRLLLDCFSVKAGANLSSNTPCATLPDRLVYRPTASPANCPSHCVRRFPPLRTCKGIVEKLRSDLKERKNKPDKSVSDPEGE